MSVLRKRTPWNITAGVMLSALALGLAGCGSGGGDDPFPPVTNPFTVSSLPPQTAQGSAAITPDGGGTITADLNPNNYNGVQSVTVTLPAGAVNTTQTVGVAIVPPSQYSLNGAGNALGGQVGFWSTVGEIVIGPVLSNGTIDPNGLNDVPLDYSFELTQQASDALASAIGDTQGAATLQSTPGGRVLKVIHVNGNTAFIDADCQVQFVRVNRRVIVIKCRGSHAIVIHLPRQHNQGGS